MPDFETLRAVKALDLSLQVSKVPHLESINLEMAMQIEALTNEVAIVNWYKEVMEDGLDTK